MKPFDAYRKNIFSQNGEDGVIGEILMRLGIFLQSSQQSPRWCVEFGAWDGKHLSNTFALVKKYAWNAVYIEGDSQKFIDLEKTALEFSTIIPVLAFVDHEKKSESSLDAILSNTPIPKDFDILSIDIDSNDLAVWNSFQKYSPKIVIIETNSSIMPGVLAWHGGKIQGNSFSSILNVGIRKNYSLVCHTGNMIFVKNDLIKLLEFDEMYIANPELLFDNSWICTNSQQSILSKIKSRVQKYLGK